MLPCYVPENSVKHPSQSETQDLLVTFQNQTHTFLTCYSPCAVPERTARWQERKDIIHVEPPPGVCLPHFHCCLQVPRLQPSSPSSLQFGKGKRHVCKEMTPCSQSLSRSLQVQRRKARLRVGGRRKDMKLNLFWGPGREVTAAALLVCLSSHLSLVKCMNHHSALINVLILKKWKILFLEGIKLHVPVIKLHAINEER